MTYETLITLRVTEAGVDVVDTSHDGEAKLDSDATPESEISKADLQPARWSHWYQRRLCKLWQATMLGLDFEPSVRARRALKKFKDDIYSEYVDRLDIAKAMYGYELVQYEDHLLEGDRPAEKYVELVDYYAFATRYNWTGLAKMKEGLKIDTSPPEPVETSQRQLNNLMVLLHEALRTQVPNFDLHKQGPTATAILEWLKDKELRSPVKDRALVGYLKDMEDSVKAHDESHSTSNGRNG